MAKVASRPRTEMTRARGFAGWALVGLLALPLMVAVGCNTGSRNEPGEVGFVPSDTDPFVLSVTPEGGRPGDIITIIGRNFSPAVEDNRVFFTNNNASISIPGKVETVVVDPFIEGEGSPSTMTVRVPTGVRSGFVNVEVDNVDDGNGNFLDGVPAGGSGFVGAPVVTGYAINDDGLGYVIRQPFGTPQPDTITLIGYNLVNNVTDVFIADDQSSSIPADAVQNGIPFTATYTLPTGMDALTITLPNGLIVANNCNSQALVLTAVASGLGAAGTASPITVPLAEPGPNPGDIEPCVTAISIPAGIRSGVIDIPFSFGADPSSSLWEAEFEYLDPTDLTGQTWLPVTQDPNQTIIGASRFIPGGTSDSSSLDGFIGPGSVYTLHWDSATDLPGTLGLVTTQVRILWSEDSPGGIGVFTPSCVPDYTTPRIVVNNDVGVTGAVLEEFTSNNQQAPGTNAIWNGAAAPGALTAAPGLPISPLYGNGTDDILLLSSGDYTIDSDFTSVLDLTEPLNPVELLVNNPGAAAGEFHVRSLIIEAGADITWQGENPALFRISGDGLDSSIVCRIDQDLIFDGESALDAAPNENSLGGAGGVFGGGDGGDGAIVNLDTVNNVVDTIEPAEDGELNGGKGGQSTSFVSVTSNNSSPRAGCGGGGGHAEFGGDGFSAIYIDTGTLNSITMPSALGGPPAGNKFLTTLNGGAGGGGGGASAVLSTVSFTPRNGGGGGGGGGAFGIVARGSVQLLGAISCKGGNGGKGSPGQQSGAGGGGAGGSILVRATGNVEFGTDATLDVAGGFGAFQSTSSTSPVFGGDGSPGRIAVQGNLLQPGSNEGTFFPPLINASVSVGVFSVGTLAPPAESFLDLDGGALNPVGFPVVTDPLDDNFGLVEYVLDTDAGTVSDPNGLVVFTNPSLSATPPGDSWVFELRNLVVPDGIALVGRGSMPLIFRVSGQTQIDGTIDVSGENGGFADYTDPLNPLPGLGGEGGAGGGRGGDGGGVISNSEVTAATAGELPATVPASLLDSTPPLGGGGGTGNPLPTATIAAAQPGLSVIGGGGCFASAGGGGGFATAGTSGATATGCPSGGDGGSLYGSNFFVISNPDDPTESLDLKAGGGGGAGGGAFADVASRSPGTGGGGGGGYLEIYGRGPIFLGQNSVLDARGGDALMGPTGAGNGGSGAGGAIRVRGLSTVQISAGAEVQVAAGAVNLEPPVGSYPGGVNGLVTGGQGAIGRVRIETPLGFADQPFQDLGPSYLGAFMNAELRERVAVTRDYRVVAEDRGTIFGGAVFPTLPEVSKYVGTVPPGTEVRVLYQGAKANPANPALPGEFYGPTDDTAHLSGAEFIRMRISLFTTETEAPVIESVEVPFGE